MCFPLPRKWTHEQYVCLWHGRNICTMRLNLKLKGLCPLLTPRGRRFCPKDWFVQQKNFFLCDLVFPHKRGIVYSYPFRGKLKYSKNYIPWYKHQWTLKKIKIIFLSITKFSCYTNTFRKMKCSYNSENIFRHQTRVATRKS